jgi:hypothetical protein
MLASLLLLMDNLPGTLYCPQSIAKGENNARCVGNTALISCAYHPLHLVAYQDLSPKTGQVS